jgi:hypothetical protein
MSPDYGETSPTNPIEIRFSQLFAAFGQGTGPIFVSLEAVQAARAQYFSLIQQNVSTWDANALVLFEYVRALGRTSAFLAAQEGATMVTGGHYQQAASLVAGSQAFSESTDIDCPFC